MGLLWGLNVLTQVTRLKEAGLFNENYATVELIWEVNTNAPAQLKVSHVNTFQSSSSHVKKKKKKGKEKEAGNNSNNIFI